MAEPLILKVRPLTAEAFAPYGDVLEVPARDGEPMNQGWAQRYRDVAEVDADDEAGAVAISLVRSKADAAPVALRLVERHPLGSQIFMPLGANPFVVVVGLAGEVPARDQLTAFVTNGTQGVNYHKGVWHHPMIALQATSDFLVIDRKGPGNNCDESAIVGGDVEVQL
jgi:ureidoglycolate lyase